MTRRSFARLAVSLLFFTAARDAAAGSCVRPTDPGGIDDYAYGSATVKSFGNDKVLVWYATDGTNAVNTATTRGDGVPDDVAEVAQVTSDTITSYASMGFRAPVSDGDTSCGSNGGDDRLDVYLVKMVGGDGMTVSEQGRCTSAGKAQRCASFVFAQANYAALYPSASIGIHTVLPHETFHAVQNAYDANIDRFWAEGTAQWAAKTLDPSLTDLERFLPDFFSSTSKALDAPVNGVTAGFLYGAAIWPVFLTAQHGNDIVKQVLEQEGVGGDGALAATDAVLQANDSSSMANDFPLFAAWNAATGKRAGSGGYSEGSSYPEVTIAELEDGAASGITSGYATYYYHVQSDGPQSVTIEDSYIFGFGSGSARGVSIDSTSSNVQLFVNNTTINNNTGGGIVVQPSTGFSAGADLNNVRLLGNGVAGLALSTASGATALSATILKKPI